MKRFLSLVLAAGLLAACGPSLAAEGDPAGRVKRTSGQVTLERGSTALAVQPGTVVLAGDRIRTGADGLVGITLADDSLLTTGPNSTLVIDQFEFNPTTHDGSLLATLARGTLNMVTGLIAKKTPEKVTVKTPTVVLGVRGTEFLVEAKGSEP